MPNFWTATTRKIYEMFSGPKIKDTEFNNKVEELKSIEKSVENVKGIYSNFYNNTSGSKDQCRAIYKTLSNIYDDKSPYWLQIKEIINTYMEIEKLYDSLAKEVNDIAKVGLSWENKHKEVHYALLRREEVRRKFEHYEEKWQKLTKKKDSESEEYCRRNEDKFRKAMEEYLQLSYSTYQLMEDLINYRYNYINPTIVKYHLAQRKYYTSVASLFANLENLELAFSDLDRVHNVEHLQYDPTKFIRPEWSSMIDRSKWMVDRRTSNVVVNDIAMERHQPKVTNIIANEVVNTLPSESGDHKEQGLRVIVPSPHDEYHNEYESMQYQNYQNEIVHLKKSNETPIKIEDILIRENESHHENNINQSNIKVDLNDSDVPYSFRQSQFNNNLNNKMSNFQKELQPHSEYTNYIKEEIIIPAQIEQSHQSHQGSQLNQIQNQFNKEIIIEGSEDLPLDHLGQPLEQIKPSEMIFQNQSPIINNQPLQREDDHKAILINLDTKLQYPASDYEFQVVQATQPETDRLEPVYAQYSPKSNPNPALFHHIDDHGEKKRTQSISQKRYIL